MGEKEALEFHALQYFVATYNRSHDSQLLFIGLRQSPEPDALCLLNGKELGVEVTHLYGSSLDAKRRLGRLQKKPPTVGEERANRL
jgi:hypothetical protein